MNTTRIGEVTFSARGRTACRLRGRPHIDVYGSAHRLNVQQQPGAVLGDTQDSIAQTIVVAPSHPAGAAFDWVNWCGEQFHSPTMLRITLPRHGGTVSVYVRYGYIDRSATTPACLNPSAPSTITIGFIRAVTPAHPLP